MSNYFLPVPSRLSLFTRLRSEGKILPMVLFTLLSVVLTTYVWVIYPAPVAAAYTLLNILLLIGSLIDIDQFIIPDSVTLGGTAAGLICSFLLPPIMLEESRWYSLLDSAKGAIVGAGMLWAVVEGGKLVFGKKTLDFPSAVNFSWLRKGDDADLKINGDSLLWSDIFSRESDKLLLQLPEGLVVDGHVYVAGHAVFHYNRLLINGVELKLDEVNSIEAMVSKVIVPREAMGFGDVKLIAAVGAFLGWQGAVFTVFSSSVIGFVVGLSCILVTRDRSKTILPYGPYLALGAMLWLVFREQIVGYWNLL